MGQPFLEHALAGSAEVKTHACPEPVVPNLGTYHEKCPSDILQKTCMRVYRFIRVPNWKQDKCPPRGKLINKR